MTSTKAVCGNCGAQLSLPVPPRCPKCNTKIGKVRQSGSGAFVSVLVIGLCFLFLVGFLYWLVAQ